MFSIASFLAPLYNDPSSGKCEAVGKFVSCTVIMHGLRRTGREGITPYALSPTSDDCRSARESPIAVLFCSPGTKSILAIIKRGAQVVQKGVKPTIRHSVSAQGS
jgi:hypothetical protein